MLHGPLSQRRPDSVRRLLQGRSQDRRCQRSVFQQLPDQRLLSVQLLYGYDSRRPRQLLQLQRVDRHLAKAGRPHDLHDELHVQQGARHPRQRKRQRPIGNGNTLWPYSLRPNYGVLNFDHTQIFNLAYVINLPSAIKGKDAGMKVLGGLLNGWVASGITQIQSGAPIQGNTGGTLNVELRLRQPPQRRRNHHLCGLQRADSNSAPTAAKPGAANHLRSAQRSQVRTVLQSELLRAADSRAARETSSGRTSMGRITSTATFRSTSASRSRKTRGWNSDSRPSTS